MKRKIAGLLAVTMVATAVIAQPFATTTLADNSSAGVEQAAEKTNLLAEVDNQEVTPENLGIPGEKRYEKQYYARNIWDMAVKDGKVLLSMGDYNSNTNATPIYYYTNDSTEKKECTYVSTRSTAGLSSEAIERFFRIDGEVYATATDPLQMGDGSYYKFDSAKNQWTDYYKLPTSIHCYDMVEYQGEVFFAGMVRNNKVMPDIISCVQKISKDQLATDTRASNVEFYDMNGEKFKLVDHTYQDKNGNTKVYTESPYWRSYDMFVFKDKLYAAHCFYTEDSRTEEAGLFVYNKEKNRFEQIYTGNAIKGFMSVTRNTTSFTYEDDNKNLIKDDNGKVVGSYVYFSFEDNKAVYHPLKIGKEDVYGEPMCSAKISTPNTFVAVCNGIFKSKDVKTFEKVSLGEGYENYVTRDAFELGGKYYFLASQMNGTDNYTTAVFETDGNFAKFRKVLSFPTKSFARSFAYNDGMLYVGIGSAGANEHAGTLYRVDLSKWVSKQEEPTTEKKEETKPAEPTTEKKQETKPAEPTTEKKQETKPAEPTTPSVPTPSVPAPSVPVLDEPERPVPPKNTTVETREDGTKVETTTETTTDGTKVETVTETTTKGVVTQKETKVQTDGSSVVTTKTEGITVVVNKNTNGNIASAKAYCTITGSKTAVSAKASISKEVLQQVTSLSGTNQVKVTIKIQVPVVVKQKDLFTANQTQTAYTVTLNANDVKENNPLYIYAYDSNKKQYTMVNATTYKVQEDGSLSINVPAGKAYVLLNKTDMTKVSNKILSTVKLAATTKTMKPGKKTKVTFSKGLDMANVKKVTYLVSNKKVATVSSKGVVTCKKKGTVTVKVKVTLKNGKTKTLSMKVKINKK